MLLYIIAFTPSKDPYYLARSSLFLTVKAVTEAISCHSLAITFKGWLDIDPRDLPTAYSYRSSGFPPRKQLCFY